MRPTHLLSDGFMLMRIFSLVLSAYPQRSGPHGSTRTLPLFSSVAHTPIGVAAAGVAGGAVAGAAAAGVAAAGADRVSNPTHGIESVEATVAAGAVAVAAGAAFGGGGSARSATLLSSSRCFDLKPLKSNPESERPGADTLRQDSELQSFGASMWIFCPLISKEIELPA